MKIGLLAIKSGLSIQAIRFYERRGLLAKPSRTEKNYRIYGDDALQQLLFIKQCRSLNMSIEEIIQLLITKAQPETTCESINGIIAHHIDEVAIRIKELKTLQNTLISIQSACQEEVNVKDCGILNELENRRSQQ